MQAAAPVANEPLLAANYEHESFGRMLVSCPIDLDDWSLDADLREADRLLKALGQKLRLDQPAPQKQFASPSAAAGTDAFESEQQSHRGAATAPSRGGFLHWLVLCGSLVALACGGVLLGWAYFGGRSDLWVLGLPFALIGQGGLILGLMLQISGLASSNRAKQATLEQMDARMHRLRKTSVAPTPQRGPMPHFANYDSTLPSQFEAGIGNWE